MQPGLRALLEGIIDYAGLFPPAELDLDEAIRNYAAYRRSPEAWMLARFICPATRLAELDPYHDELFAGHPPFRFSVLGRGGADLDAFLVGLNADREAIERFRDRHGDRVNVEAFEVRLPAAVVDEADRDAVHALAGDALRVIATLAPPVHVSFEAGLGKSWRNSLPRVIEALSAHATAEFERPAAGFKLRCGGVTADAFPSPEQVAFVIAACRDADVPIKFTAGLHHPIRHFNPGVNAVMHGFINVFAAGIFARAWGLEPARIQAVLEEENPGHFAFDDRGLAWKGYHVSAERIASIRAAAVTSYGSCSFDEPRDDLHQLGLLDRT